MPYRIDVGSPPEDALDILVGLGALDIESAGNGIAAILPDGVTPATVVAALGVKTVGVSTAVAKDDGSVWLLSPRAIHIRQRVPSGSTNGIASPTALRLIDSSAFGTGHHPTTALCIEALEEVIALECPNSILDVGTGSGILAVAALIMGVPQGVCLDIDANALRIAAENARLNNVADRLQFVLGGPDRVDDNWPLVVANLLAAPLIEMAPVLVRRIGKRGHLVLSGIPWSLEFEVRKAYQRCGMRSVDLKTRAGWTVVTMQASW